MITDVQTVVQWLRSLNPATSYSGLSHQELGELVIEKTRIIAEAQADYNGNHQNAAQWCFIQQVDEELNLVIQELSSRGDQHAG